MILRPAHCQIWLRGLISCPGQLPNQSMLEFHMYSNFSVHMVFMCRPCAKLFSSANILPAMKRPCMDSIFHIEFISEIENVFWRLGADQILHYQPNLTHFLIKATCVHESRLSEKPAHLTPYYSLSSISKGYKLYESLISSIRGRDSHDLLRQQSENVFSRSKIWWIMRFSWSDSDF